MIKPERGGERPFLAEDIFMQMFKRDIAQQVVGKADSQPQCESLNRREWSLLSCRPAARQKWGWPKGGEKGGGQVHFVSVFEKSL